MTSHTKTKQKQTKNKQKGRKKEKEIALYCISGFSAVDLDHKSTEESAECAFYSILIAVHREASSPRLSFQTKQQCANSPQFCLSQATNGQAR